MPQGKPSRCTSETSKQGVLVNAGDASYGCVILVCCKQFHFRETIAAWDGAAPAAHQVCRTRDSAGQVVRGTRRTFTCRTKDEGSGFVRHVTSSGNDDRQQASYVLTSHFTARLPATRATL